MVSLYTIYSLFITYENCGLEKWGHLWMSDEIIGEVRYEEFMKDSIFQLWASEIRDYCGFGTKSYNHNNPYRRRIDFCLLLLVGFLSNKVTIFLGIHFNFQVKEIASWQFIFAGIQEFCLTITLFPCSLVNLLLYWTDAQNEV